MRMRVQSLASLSGSGIRRCCESPCSSQLRLRSRMLRPWCRPVATTALIRPLAWEPPWLGSGSPKIDIKTKKKKKKSKCYSGVPVVAQRVMNPTSVHEVVGSVPGLALWAKDLLLP